MAQGAASAVQRGRERVQAVRDSTRAIRGSWRRRRYFAHHPSRAADPDVRDRENSFFQVARIVVADIERIENCTEHGQRAETARARRDARGDAVSARHDAKRAFPRLVQALDTDIAQTSSREIDTAARLLIECIEQYLLGNTVSRHLHPSDALADLHGALYDQAAWDLPGDGPDEDGDDPEDGDGLDEDDETGLVDEPLQTGDTPVGVTAAAAAVTAADVEGNEDRGDTGSLPAAGAKVLVDTAGSALGPANPILAGAPRTRELIAKRAGDPAYRAQLLDARYEPHIAPFNQYVDALREERGEWLPYVAPTYGGVNARLLSLFQDPGPKTRDGNGSGMLCVENPDESAARYLRLLTDAGIEVSDTLSWNSYPWYIGRPPSDRELDDALPVLVRILEMLPRLEVVMLQGGTARQAWKRLSLAHPVIAGRVQEVISTYHTSPRAIAQVSPTERARREQKLADDFARARSVLSR